MPIERVSECRAILEAMGAQSTQPWERQRGPMLTAPAVLIRVVPTAHVDPPPLVLPSQQAVCR